MELLPARDHGCGKCDPGAASKIARQVDESGGVTGLFFGNEIESHGVDRHEQKSQAQALNDSRPDRVLEIDVQIEVSHLVETIRRDEQSEDDQPTSLEFGE